MLINNLNNQNTYIGTVMFCRKESQSDLNPNRLYMHPIQKEEQPNKPKLHQLFLLSESCEFNIFDIMPKLFKLSTKNKTCHFNLEMLQKISPVISDFIKANPNEDHYNLNINDDENVLVKFERLFIGETVIFDEDELLSSQQITKKLQIKNCPNYLKPRSLIIEEVNHEGHKITSYRRNQLESGVVLNKIYFANFLKSDSIFQRFTIFTNSKSYKCNIYGSCSSNIIKKIIEENPNQTEYIFEYDDEFNEFQLICDLFNFNQIDIKRDNIESLREISEKLQINCILKQINDYEKFSQKVNEQQIFIDSTEILFELLYNIKEYGINKVEHTIIQSKWIQNEDDVLEFGAFVIQVIKSGFDLHDEIAELLIRLNNDSIESNKLNVLLPFIVKYLMTFYMPKTQQALSEIYFRDCYFGSLNYPNGYIESYLDKSNRFVYSFIRVLYKRGIISKEEIFKSFQGYDFLSKYFNAFFLPELLEYNPSNIDLLTYQNTNLGYSTDKEYRRIIAYIEQYLPNGIDKFQKMIDKREPDDELTKSLIYDDVDKLQSIIIKHQIDISKAVIPYNIIDDFDENPTIINYAAFRGSIKCFKYLLLNDGIIDKNSLYFAVYGNNSEIIKIVDKELQNKNDDRYYHNDNNYYPINGIKKCDFSSDNEIIASSIKLHRNNLFDWIFEKRFVNKGKIGNDLYEIAKISVLNGNAHSFIEIIDKGFDISSNDILSIPAQNGFYKLTQIILNIINQEETKFDVYKNFDFQSAVHFGNLSIFKLFLKQMNRKNIEHNIIFAISMNYKSIRDFYYETIDEENYRPTILFISNSIKASLKFESDDLFHFLIEKYKKLLPNVFDIYRYQEILTYACTYSKLSIVKILTDLILKENPEFDFTNVFFEAASNGLTIICQYFIDKKVFINYNIFVFNATRLGLIDYKLFEYIYQKVNPKLKYKLLKVIDNAIEMKNKNLIQFLLEEKAPLTNALYKAVLTKDVEIVDLILKYNSKSSYVNQICYEGQSALSAAVFNNYLKIVNRLLTIPGIDIKTRSDHTSCLSFAISHSFYEIVDSIINYFGDDIQSHLLTIHKSLENLLDIHFDAKYNWKMILKLLQIKSVDPNCYYENKTIFYIACDKNEIEVVKKLLKIEKIDINKYELYNYNTPLMAAINKKKLEIVHLLIKHPKTNINLKNCDNDSALNIAIKSGLKQIVEILINDEKFDPIESRLDYAFYMSDATFAKILSKSPFLDVNHAFDANEKYYNSSIIQSCYDNHQSIKYDDLEKTALIHSIEDQDTNKFDIIIHHHSFNIEKSDVNRAIFIAAQNNDVIHFIKLIKLINNNVNIHDDISGFNLLVFAAKKLSGNIIDKIFSNDTFDPNSSTIVEAFINSFSKPPKNTDNRSIIKTMKKIYEYDLSHSHLIDFSKLLKNGHSFFTCIKSNYYKIDKVCEFLLNHGADPNMPDKFGVFPLQHAIKLGYFEFGCSLINSNKIDYSQLPNGNSYLHYAASCSNVAFCRFFVVNKLIDINAVNDKGETPLMEACKKGDFFCVDFLFKQDGLDYLHCDKDGNDALNLISSSKTKEKIKSKEVYFQKIISIFQENYEKTELDYN